MQLLTTKVWSRDGEMVRVNLEDVAAYCARGYSTVDPSGGTFSREVKPAAPEVSEKPKARKGL